MEGGRRALVEIRAVDGAALQPGRGAQHDIADRLLRHAIDAEQRAFRAMHLEAGAGVFRREGVVELRQQAGREADRAHDAVLDALARHAARTGSWP